MKYTIPIKKDMVTARSTKRLSTKSALAICRKINNTKFKLAKEFIDGLITKKKNINGKYYTKAAKGLKEVIELVESNAKNKGLEPDEMKLKISVHQGPGMLRRRRKNRFGFKIKTSHVHAILEKRG